MVISIEKKPLAKVKKLAWEQFSIFIRRRDSEYGKCITCLSPLHWKAGHAGHFIHGSTKRSYFCEQNVHLQCQSCNFFKDGARDLYALRLIEKYGDGIIQKLHAINQNDKRVWSKGELVEIYHKYKALNAVHN